MESMENRETKELIRKYIEYSDECGINNVLPRGWYPFVCSLLNSKGENIHSGIFQYGHSYFKEKNYAYIEVMDDKYAFSAAYLRFPLNDRFKWKVYAATFYNNSNKNP